MTVHSGWYLLAFRSELDTDVTPLAIGPRRLVAVRDGEDLIRVFDGSCPHRGAHLGYGGKLDGGCLVCPFHGKRIALGDTSKRWSVGEHPVLVAGDAVFVRLSREDADDRGFEARMREWARTHPVVQAVAQPVSADSALVVENAFDADHFTALHKVPKVRGMTVSHGDSGELVIDGDFLMQTSPWQDARAKEKVRWDSVRTGVVRWDYVPRFHARAFSPGVVVTEFGPAGREHVIITGAVPNADGSGSTARVAIGVRPGQEGELPMLITGSERALAEDAVIWDHLDPDHVPRYDPGDAPVVAYRAFCQGFRDLSRPEPSPATTPAAS
ncbi:Rieske 2Fe-2S domain-containing protein [Streptomyces sp. NPDC005408]|uniref:Rieske 2Fe-2S domain-containing protein n=1 Tax=Streptomyces sp. NPDC005408 TaxID=3155341 RepID=UPI0033B28321